ncbi:MULTISPECIES: acireductone synthase [Actinomadura]|uniref:Enolase-phosphatase E1 n=1 Tax=Actinomadura litoris TaxID=2678616 RepID=A0A7K1L3P2_9ACTN|nr:MULTISPECIES: acireductone synthase [Actinomadura]MBT2210162.1 acireductone synthase [Actinomadura sp. NEAU-AAG7]MUN39017.1 acireductone synthase [Actinomadura litoris]
MTGAVVLDIEGTTSSTAHVQEVLFPYARERLRKWVADHEDQARDVLRETRERLRLEDAPDDDAAVIRALERWSDEDRKVAPLKTLQGMIWAEGFATGEVTGHVYPDTLDALREWRLRGVPVYVYSSGSVQAQRLWFAHTQFGDLRRWLRGHFDITTAGPKKEANSYRLIAGGVGVPAEEMLFVSDLARELDAARRAKWRTALVNRPEENPGGASGAGPGTEAAHPVFTDLVSVALA